jgi:hypothetical protein
VETPDPEILKVSSNAGLVIATTGGYKREFRDVKKGNWYVFIRYEGAVPQELSVVFSNMVPSNWNDEGQVCVGGLAGLFNLKEFNDHPESKLLEVNNLACTSNGAAVANNLSCGLLVEGRRPINLYTKFKDGVLEGVKFVALPEALWDEPKPKVVPEVPKNKPEAPRPYEGPCKKTYESIRTTQKRKSPTQDR